MLVLAVSAALLVVLAVTVLVRGSLETGKRDGVVSERPERASREETAMAPADETAHTNRLIDETSPYLLQHARNPVDWYPWGEAAFARAIELDECYDSGGPHRSMAVFLAQAYFLGGRSRDDAIVHFERSIELDPTYLENHVNYAEYYARPTSDNALFDTLIATVLEAAQDLVRLADGLEVAEIDVRAGVYVVAEGLVGHRGLEDLVLHLRVGVE